MFTWVSIHKCRSPTKWSAAFLKRYNFSFCGLLIVLYFVRSCLTIIHVWSAIPKNKNNDTFLNLSRVRCVTRLIKHYISVVILINMKLVWHVMYAYHFVADDNNGKSLFNVKICCLLFKFIQGSHTDWETWGNGRAFSSREIWTFWKKSGNFTQNAGKVKKFCVIWILEYLKFLLHLNIKHWKILEKSGNLSVRRCGNHLKLNL